MLPAVVIAGASGALLVRLDHPVALAGQVAKATQPNVGAATSSTTSASGNATTTPPATAAARPSPDGGFGNDPGGGFGPDDGDGGPPPDGVSPGQFPPRPQPGQGFPPRQRPGQGQAGGQGVGGQGVGGQGTSGTTTPPATAPPGCTGAPTNGPVVDTRFGPVQVAATVSSTGALCDVKALQTPSSHRRSVQINNYAVPILHDRAIAAQGANFDIVTGATLTSDAYAESLQSILDHR